MNLIQWVAVGAGDKKTRFHDSRGNLIDFEGIKYMPKAFISSLLYKGFGYRPVLPWLSYRAINEISSLMQKNWKVLEFGSGMSTLWFAERCEVLYSIEHNEVWYEKVSKMINSNRLKNVVYEHRDSTTYGDLSKFEDDFFDFALIDGIQRNECVMSVLSKIKKSAFIYLDNCDVNPTSTNRDTRMSEQLLLDAAKERNGKAKYFTDFAPGQFIVNQGLLVKL